MSSAAPLQSSLFKPDLYGQEQLWRERKTPRKQKCYHGTTKEEELTALAFGAEQLSVPLKLTYKGTEKATVQNSSYRKRKAVTRSIHGS